MFLISLLSSLILTFNSAQAATISLSTSDEVTQKQLSFFNKALTVNVSYPSLLTPNRIIFKLDFFDSNGLPIAMQPSDLFITIEMPSMPDMGKPKVKVTNLIDSTGAVITGALIAKPIFSMSGAWQMNIQITNNSGTTPDIETQPLSIHVN